MRGESFFKLQRKEGVPRRRSCEPSALGSQRKNNKKPPVRFDARSIVKKTNNPNTNAVFLTQRVFREIASRVVCVINEIVVRYFEVGFDILDRGLERIQLADQFVDP